MLYLSDRASGPGSALADLKTNPDWREDVAKRRDFPSPIKFISIWFNDKERSEYEAWIADRTISLEDVLVEFCDSGYKVSASLDQSKDTYIVSVTNKNPPKNQEASCLMFRHRDLLKCYLIASFYYTVVLDWNVVKVSEDDSLDW